MREGPQMPVPALQFADRQSLSCVHALRQAWLLQLLLSGQATFFGPPQVSEQVPALFGCCASGLLAQKAGCWPQSASAAQGLPTREGPHRPVETLQLLEPQSASWVHFGRQRFLMQRCSARQPVPSGQLLMQILTVSFAFTQVAPLGQVPVVVQ